MQQENNNLLRKNADLEDRINNIDAKFAKKIRDLENENQKTVRFFYFLTDRYIRMTNL